MSVTFRPRQMQVNAVWYGCGLSEQGPDVYGLPTAELITRRLSSFDGGILHPMILPIMFADIERNRQIDLVRDRRAKLMGKIIDLFERQASDIESPVDRQITDRQRGKAVDPDVEAHKTSGVRHSVMTLMKHLGLDSRREPAKSEKRIADEGIIKELTPSTMLQVVELPTSEDSSESAATLWMDMGYLKGGLQAWRAQLEKMATHVEELHDPERAFGLQWNDAKIQLWQQASFRIQDRLRELFDEYDEHIRECSCIMDGLQLATKMVSSLAAISVRLVGACHL